VRINNSLTAVIAYCVILAPAMLSAEAMARTNRAHHRPHYRSQLQRAPGCPVRRLADGSLVDCQGWRKWSGSVGWDNNCLNLDYLPSQFACGSAGGGSRR
jgi:hypothetical protein